MKNKLIVIATSILLFSCTSSDSNEVKELNSNDNAYSIELVNNEKWIVNDEMMPHIQNMKAEITQFTDTNSYTKLGEDLDNHIGLLTANCTMKGQAHDELHKWLLPLIDLVEALNEAKTPENQEIALKELKQSFEVFNKYFE